MSSFIEIHHRGAWQRAATIQVLGDDRCRIDYLPEHIFGEDPQTICLGLPLEFNADARDATGPQDGAVDRRMPPFLYDLVPQGRGRMFLANLLKLADRDSVAMPLLMNGAFNPIGRVRISSALDFYRGQASLNPDPSVSGGFDLKDIESKSEDFLQHLALHAMLSGGTTGVQGVAPKFLLTQDEAGHWYADMALDDSLARVHWLVKLPRGRTQEDLVVHRNEAAYLRVASAAGIDVLGDPVLNGRMLFVRRFDRLVDERGVTRRHQESLASLAGLRGFGAPTTQNELLAALRRHVTDPLSQTIEFLKRDVLNLALRNTDNHARNSAVQIKNDTREDTREDTKERATVALTPLFDFGPMFMDPEVVPRSVHWRNADGVRMDSWIEIIEQLDIPDAERADVAGALREFSGVVERLPHIARDCGVEEQVLELCLRSIEDQCRSLEALPATPRKPRRHRG